MDERTVRKAVAIGIEEFLSEEDLDAWNEDTVKRLGEYIARHADSLVLEVITIRRRV